jgi:hypothetical protein
MKIIVLKSFFHDDDVLDMIFRCKNYPLIKFFETTHYNYLCRKRIFDGKAYRRSQSN